MPTLEEVFLRLGDDEEVEDQNENEEKLQNTEMKLSEKIENGDDIVGYEFETVSTKKNWWQTYSALLYVRGFQKLNLP